MTVYAGLAAPSRCWRWRPALVIAGYGQGLVMSPLFGVVLSEVPPDSAGAAAAC